MMTSEHDEDHGGTPHDDNDADRAARNQPYIVATINKSWPEEYDINRDGLLLAQRFEVIINYNWLRGYTLHSWQLSRLQTPVEEGFAPHIDETIIAIFKLREKD